MPKSTCETEYIAAAGATTLTLWLLNLIAELQLNPTTPTLHVYNTAGVQMAKNRGATEEENTSTSSITTQTTSTEEKTAYPTDSLQRTICRYIYESAKMNTVQNAQRKPNNACPCPRVGGLWFHPEPQHALRQRAQTSTHKFSSIHMVHNYR